jgi:cyanophycinase-like exopeptidase
MQQSQSIDVSPGPIVLFGSGETSPSGRKVFESVLRGLPKQPRLALLETPAGFELNSARVIGRVGQFLAQRLQNYQPQIEIVAARKRGTPFSPDDAQVVAPLLTADLIFMGPGSPTYAVRQLRDSLAWQYILARHRLGAALVLASAATIAISASALPVYEIYKVGEELHWKGGLNFFRAYGLDLIFVPHWNNSEGGEELDTRHCFMGEERFMRLMAMLPGDMTVVGLDEKTALLIDPESGQCQVIGAGGVTLLHTGHLHKGALTHAQVENKEVNLSPLQALVEQRGSHVHFHKNGDSFPLSDIGPFKAYHPEADLPAEVWQKALAARQEREAITQTAPPEAVLIWLEERERARLRKDWQAADELRSKIEQAGWLVKDTPEGPQATPK